MITKFLIGMSLLFAGQKRVLMSRDLKKWSLVPFCLSILFVILGLVGVVVLSPWLVTHMVALVPQRPGFSGIILFYFLMVIVYLFAISAYSLFLYIIFSLISAPVFSQLAKMSLIQSDPQILAGLNNLTLLEVFKAGAKKALLFLCLSLPLLIMAFIPILNFVAIWLSLCLLSFDSLDFSLEHLQLSFGEKIKIAKSLRYEILGSGFVMALFSVIPGLIFLLLPGLAVGYAELVARTHKSYKHLLGT